jgi:hypothetical protein
VWKRPGQPQTTRWLSRSDPWVREISWWGEAQHFSTTKRPNLTFYKVKSAFEEKRPVVAMSTPFFCICGIKTRLPNTVNIKALTYFKQNLERQSTTGSQNSDLVFTNSEIS